MVSVLLASRAQINLACNLAFTPLRMGLVKNHPGILQLLLDAGAEVDCVTLKEIIPLRVVAKENSREHLVEMFSKAQFI